MAAENHSAFAFDNLIAGRPFTESLFDYYFRTEIYVPKEKRQYGYYLLSILHGDQIIGRLDAAFDRKLSNLNIHSLHLEPSAPRRQRDRRSGLACDC